MRNSCIMLLLATGFAALTAASCLVSRPQPEERVSFSGDKVRSPADVRVLTGAPGWGNDGDPRAWDPAASPGVGTAGAPRAWEAAASPGTWMDAETLGSVRIAKAEEKEGERKKSHSGRSFIDQTVVERTPTKSVSASGFDSERVWSGYDDWEPAVAVDPNGMWVYQITTRYGGPRACAVCADPALIFRSSSDAGATWSPDQFLVLSGRHQNDPMLEVAEDGSLYAVFLHDYMPGVKFIKSPDRGATWTPPIVIAPPRAKPHWSDRPVLAISPEGQHVYVAFNASDSYVAVSHDYGNSFSKPVKTNSDRRYWFHTAGALGPNGAAFFVAIDYSQDYTGDAHINVLRSIDGGKSWETSRVDTSAEPPDCRWSEGCYFGFFGPGAGIAVDVAGTVMVAYNAGSTPGGPQALYVRTSPNGLEWSEPRQVSVEASSVNNAFPAVASGTTPGDFRLVWQDDRNGRNEAWNTWYRRTRDGGETWEDVVRLSDIGSGAPYKSPDGYRFPYGDYLEIAVDRGGTNHIVWGEGDSYTGPGGTWYTRGQ